jgi:VWFA-related protein
MKNSKGVADFFYKIIKIVIFILILHNYLTTIMYALESKNVMTRSLTLDSLILIYNDVDALSFPKIVSLVTVTNEVGFIVGKLDEDNFEVREDNVRELPIQVEELTDGEIGINVVLAIDRSGSMMGQPLANAKTASSSFVELMQTNDQSAIVSFSHEPRTDYRFTKNIDSLKAAISKIQAIGGTAIFDALIHSVYIMNNSLKNRAIIVLTDGADKDSKYTYQEALNALQSNEVRVFTIGLGLNRNSSEENILKDLARKTGGLYYYSPTSGDLEEIYRAISKLLHHRYRISYTTHNPAKDGSLRHVRVDALVNNNTSYDTSSYRAPFEEKPTDPVKPNDPTFEVVPNPFTPNGDGFNDWTEFKQGDGIPLNWKISIMDRSGRMIKCLSNGERFWNGKNDAGQLMLPGSYLYTISQSNQIIHRGLIQLVR